jgi:Methyltransferase domain
MMDRRSRVNAKSGSAGPLSTFASSTLWSVHESVLETVLDRWDQDMRVNGNRFRKARSKLFVEPAKSIMPPNSPLKILDVGGRAEYWEAMRPAFGGLPLEITIANIDDGEPMAGYTKIRGDGRSVSGLQHNSFDIIHSNSVVEHVGEYSDQATMATEICRVAPNYYVQTPNRGCPIEPHFRMPFFHRLRETTRVDTFALEKIGFRRAETLEKAMALVEEIHLLTDRHMAHLFPDGRIERERVGPFVKPPIAIR